MPITLPFARVRTVKATVLKEPGAGNPHAGFCGGLGHQLGGPSTWRAGTILGRCPRRGPAST